MEESKEERKEAVVGSSSETEAVTLSYDKEWIAILQLA